MPHDIKGTEVKVGDRILIPAIVQSVQTDPQYCNCTVVTENPMPPYETGTTVTLNTRQVLVVFPEAPPKVEPTD